jgi:hypothetical protein
MKIKEFFTGYKGKNIPKELKAFNWGAFLLTFVWGIRFRAWITLLAIPLIFIQMPLMFNWILLGILQLYCGVNGNMWAYQLEWWKKPADFRKTQFGWACIAIILYIAFPILALGVIVRFIQSSPNNPQDFVINSQCVKSYKQLKKGLPNVPTNATTSNSLMAKEFASSFKNISIENNRVTFNETPQYYIEFNKLQDYKTCNLYDKNCVITSTFELPANSSVMGMCTFYIDEYKNITPDEFTENALKKGLNIFKYL